MNWKQTTWIALFILLFVPLPIVAAEGFFTTDYQDGRWWLIDPDGNRFFSKGVNVASPEGYFAPDLGYSPYKKLVQEKYGSDEAWAQATGERLTKWGFNTIGSWSSEELFAGELPYTQLLYVSGSNWLYGDVPDYFSSDFYQRLDEAIQSTVIPHANDPYLIGYFLDNEVHWGPDWRTANDLFAGYLAFPAEAPGKQALVEFLKERYSGDVERFNQTWNMSLSAFEDFYNITETVPYSFEKKQNADREAFAGMVAEHFFSTCHDAIRTADSNHLLLGIRFVSWTVPKSVARAITDYTDVVSINHYRVSPIAKRMMDFMAGAFNWVTTKDMLQEWSDLTGKPILISEFSIRGRDSGLPNTWPPDHFFYTVDTQKQRADFFEDYARQTFASGYVVGYHWFAYMDEPPEGRFDGENSNFGLVDNNDDPWEVLVSRMTEVNADALKWPVTEPGVDDDDSYEDDPPSFEDEEEEEPFDKKHGESDENDSVKCGK